MASLAITIVLGMLVGLSLGLTGGGGAIFAVPLLTYGLGLPVLEAVGVSLITVGTTAFVGTIQRARQGMVEFPTGVLFAIAGMLGAPVGAAIGERISESVLLLLFAGLMLIIALRMWLTVRKNTPELPILVSESGNSTCKRSSDGQLRLTSPCAILLTVVGLLTGLLTGLLGVGGGLIILPALVTFASMPMQRAIGTSLLVITLISASGIISHLSGGRELSFAIISPFVGGSLIGLFVGTSLSSRLQGPTLNRVFAFVILSVAAFMILQHAIGW